MRSIYKWLLPLAVAIVLIGAIIAVNNNTKETETKYKAKVRQLETQTKTQHDLEVENLKKQIEERDRKYKELEQTKAAEKARLAQIEASRASLVQRVVQTAVPVVNAAGSDAKAFIYARESGNNPGAVNASSGACGLGQALPCSKMPCSLSDYACQDNFFTGYMLSRYGSWDNARSFWLAHSWW